MKNTYSNTPVTIIIFGVTGDLMAKKVAPSLFHLFIKNKLPTRFKIVGFSRREISNTDFRSYIANVLNKQKHINFTKKELETFTNLFFYKQGNFDNLEDYKKLADSLDFKSEHRTNVANKLFYLAVPPSLYEGIFENLSNSKITQQKENVWSRIIVEKPFGHNLKTAEKLDAMLGKLFEESQIYRIDHYLGKEMLQNILAFRFSNNLLENSWNKNLIEKIEVRLFENIGVEERGDSYSSVGALRDVGQNHLLQMLALVTMENPQDLSANKVRAERIKILKSLKQLNKKEIIENTYRAQYEGFTKHSGVDKKSKSETYFKIYGNIKSKRWQGVPFILESGKSLNEQKKEIIVTFKSSDKNLHSKSFSQAQNKIVFTLEPKDEIKIYFWSKKPGFQMEVEERELEFSYRKTPEHDKDYTAEYEKLLLDSLNGDQTLFVSTEEVRAMWKFIDPIIKAWQKDLVPLTFYKPGYLPEV